MRAQRKAWIDQDQRPASEFTCGKCDRCCLEVATAASEDAAKEMGTQTVPSQSMIIS